MRGQLNFAKTPFRNERLPRILYGVATTFLVAATLVHGAVLTRYLMKEREELDVKVLDLERQIQNIDLAVSQAREDLRSQRNEEWVERIRFLAGVYRQKGFSWTRLLNELERITPDAVRITSIDPVTDKGQLKIVLTVIGRTLGDVLEMMRRLESSGVLGTVLPSEEMEDDKEGGGIRAVLSLHYMDPQPAAEAVTNEGGVNGDGATETAPITPPTAPSGEPQP